MPRSAALNGVGASSEENQQTYLDAQRVVSKLLSSSNSILAKTVPVPTPTSEISRVSDTKPLRNRHSNPSLKAALPLLSTRRQPKIELFVPGRMSYRVDLDVETRIWGETQAMEIHHEDPREQDMNRRGISKQGHAEDAIIRLFERINTRQETIQEEQSEMTDGQRAKAEQPMDDEDDIFGGIGTDFHVARPDKPTKFTTNSVKNLFKPSNEEDQPAKLDSKLDKLVSSVQRTQQLMPSLEKIYQRSSTTDEIDLDQESAQLAGYSSMHQPSLYAFDEADMNEDDEAATGEEWAKLKQSVAEITSSSKLIVDRSKAKLKHQQLKKGGEMLQVNKIMEQKYGKGFRPTKVNGGGSGASGKKQKSVDDSGLDVGRASSKKQRRDEK